MPDIYSRIRKDVADLRPCVHGARIEEMAEESKRSTEELIDFSVNLNPAGPPDLTEILAHASEKIYTYPDNRYRSFTEAAADYLGVSRESIIPGNGSSEIIRLFAETVIEPGDRVIIPHPTFSEYEFQCKLSGAEIDRVDYSDITGIDPEGYKAVFLCNPNNPTGNLLNREMVTGFAEKCRSSGTFLFVDEAFIELSDPGESIVDITGSNDFLVVLRSLTKSHAVPGLRIGFGVASIDLARVMNNIRLPWNLNSIAVETGVFLLKLNRDYIKRSLELIREERQWLVSRFEGIRGFNPYKSDVNFILIDTRDFLINSTELAGKLLEKGIIIRDCTSFGLDDHIRVAVRKRNENEILINAITSIISEWGSERAEKEIGKAVKKGVIARSRINCEYYPCHFEGQDCTFCFCPFYPCENERTGGEFIRRQTGGTVWSCQKCRLIHRADIADKVLKGLMEGKKTGEVWKIVMEPELDD